MQISKFRTGLLALLITAVGIAAWEAGLHHQQSPSGTTTTSPIPTAITRAFLQRRPDTFAQLAARLKPTVVNIRVTERAPGASNFFSPFFNVQTPEIRGQGSGVIISKNGEILTNDHVIRGATSISVTLSDGSTYPGKVIGADPTTDLALVSIDAGKPLPAAQLGDSSKVQVGDWVMAIGNPFGLDETVTVGVLSGKGRYIGDGPYNDFLQTDASINPGNSGGPLFNVAGQVVGINTAIIKGGQGIGFAVPINVAKFVVKQIKEHGHVVRGFVGLEIQQLTPGLRQSLGLPNDLRGALVAQVVSGGPSDTAGAKVGDVVTSFNGQKVRSERGLLGIVARTSVGTEASMTVYRHGDYKTLQVKVAERPQSNAASPGYSSHSHTRRLGVEVRTLTPQLAAQLGGISPGGALVTAVMPGSAAARAGLQPGDIIRRFDNQPIATAQQLAQAVQAHNGPMALLVERNGREVYIVAGQ